MIGAVTVLVVSGALVAGCGGAEDGFTAAQDAPSATPAAGSTPAASAAAPATPVETPESKALGAYPEASKTKPTFRSYDNFSRTRAGKIFVSPIPPKGETPAAAPSDSSGSTSTPTISVPGGSTGTGGTGTSGGATGTTTPAPSPIPTVGPVGSGYTASVDVSGATQNVKVGDILQGQFTVKTITADTITIELIAGSFPGGTNTMDIKVGGSATLTDPAGTTYVVSVKSITPEP
jgi:hypothetical protein